MNELVYLLQVNLCIAAFYMVYKLLLARETFFHLNRFYLLASSIASFIIPMVAFNEVPRQVMPVVHLKEVAVSAIQAPVAAGAPVNVFIIAYLSGAVFFALLFLYRLFSIVSLIVRSTRVRKEDHTLVLADNINSPFSFLHFIVVNKNDVPDRVIISHELVHVRQKHTLDVLLLEVISIICWFNPLCRLVVKEVKTVHEYIADKSALKAEAVTTQEYSRCLLDHVFNTRENQLINSFFNQSILKRRIIMINKKKSHRLAILKYVAIIPAVAGMMLITSDGALAQELKSDTKKQVTSKNEKGEDVYTVAEEMPKYPGGEEELFTYLSKSIKYPENAKKNNVEGTVFITFVVDKSGEVTDAKVLRGINEECDEMALNVVKSMPRWVPGKEKGKVVNVQYNLPIKFKLQEKK